MNELNYKDTAVVICCLAINGNGVCFFRVGFKHGPD